MIKRKYKNIKKVVNGIEFDSIKEANRYQELLLLQKAGSIKYLALRPVFTLQEPFKIGKTTHRAITYIADFSYILINKDDDYLSRAVIEDTKGFKTEVYRIKKKLLLFKYPDIDFREI